MVSYFLRRLFFIVPTLLGIMILNYLIVQAAPGGPIEQMIAKIRGTDISATARFEGQSFQETPLNDSFGSVLSEDISVLGKYKGARGLDPAFIKELEILYGFDKPLFTRLFLMLKNYASFNFGTSYFRGKPVIELICDKLPVSISLGLWTTLIVYLLSIPLGIAKAMRDGTKFDTLSSMFIIIGYSIPSFLFALLLIVLFAGGSFWNIFPLRGLTSDGFASFSFFHKITDYMWHMTLPLLAMIIGGFASLTLLTKNSFLEEIRKNYVMTARAKGLGEHRILFHHIFRNAMLIVISGFPSALMHIFFTSALLVEIIFSLDGLGLLGFEATISRDYPIMFGTLYIYTLIGLFMNLMGDLTYTFVDPRITFSKQEG